MPVVPGRQATPEATRAKVLKIAGDLFYHQGFDAVGVNEIAMAAGASKLSIYRYFGSKEGLFAAVVQDRSAATHERIAGRLAEVGGSGRDRLLAAFDVLLDLNAERHFLGCPVINAVTDARGRAENPAKAIAREHLERYRELLIPLLIEAGVVDPSAIASTLIMLIEGSTVVSTVEGSDEALRQARRAAEALIQ